MSSTIRRLLDRLDIRACALFGLPFLLYILTLAPTIYNLDSAELATAAATGGLVRATGYPLYLILGHLWSKIPLGDIGYRFNLFSAFCGALTILLADQILRKLSVHRWAAFGALGLLATSPYFWGLSLIAEVYTLHTALMAFFILALLRWSDQPTPARMGVAGLIAGLGLAHHLAMVLLLPAAVAYTLFVSPRKSLAPKVILVVLVSSLAGLSLYLYLPFRYLDNPAFNYAGVYDASLQFQPVNLLTLKGMWWLVTGRSFAGEMFAYQGTELWSEIRHFAAQLGQSFFAIGIGPGILGLVTLARRSWRQAALLTMMFVFSAVFYIDYRVGDKDTMFLPAYLVWAIWLGVGYQALLNWVKPTSQAGTWRFGRVLLGGLMISAVALAVAWNWRLVDLSKDWSTRRRGESILRQVKPNAIVFGWWDTVPIVQYLQLVEGKRPDVLAVNRFLISPEDMSRAIEKEALIRPIYIDSSPTVSIQNLQLLRVGPLYRLIPGSRTRESNRLLKTHSRSRH